MLKDIGKVVKYNEPKQIVLWKIINQGAISPELKNLDNVSLFVLNCPSGTQFLNSRPLAHARKIQLMRETMDNMIFSLHGLPLNPTTGLSLQFTPEESIGILLPLRGAQHLNPTDSLNNHIFNGYPRVFPTDFEHCTRTLNPKTQQWECYVASKEKPRYNTKIKFIMEGALASGCTVHKLTDILHQEQIQPKTIFLCVLCGSYQGAVRLGQLCQKYGIYLNVIFNGGILDMPPEGSLPDTDLPAENMVTTNGILRKLYRRYQVNLNNPRKLCLVGDVGDSISPFLHDQEHHVSSWLRSIFSTKNNSVPFDPKTELNYLHTYSSNVLTRLHKNNTLMEINEVFGLGVKNHLQTLNLIES